MCDHEEEDMEHRKPKYELLEVVPIPDVVPELGIEAGTTGTVVDVLDEGRLVTVDVSDDEGRTIDLINVRLEPEPRVVGRWHMGESLRDGR